MRFDRQTLAWVNQSKFWIRRMLPNYINYGIAENAELPIATSSIFRAYLDKNGKQHNFISDGWGAESWHHSVNLVNNECRCDRCLGISDEWDEYNVIKRKIGELDENRKAK